MIYDLPVEKSARPRDWEVKAISGLAEVVGGGTPDTGVAAYWHPPEIPWVTPTDITSCRGSLLTKTERCISREGLRDSSATLLPIGTTLLTSRATVGECKLAGVEAATNQGFASLIPKDKVDPRFLFYLAQTVKPAFVRLAAGTTFLEVSRREVRRVNVCIPSRSVERLEIGRILTMADDALAAAEAKLAAARRLKSALMQQLFTRGMPGRHIDFQQTKVGEVPKGWKVATIQSVLEGFPFNGVSPQSRDEPPGTPILNVACISDGICTTKHISYVDVDEQTAEECRAVAGDFYVLRGNGNREYVATGGLLTDEPDVPTIFSDKLIRLRFQPSKIVARYIPYLWQSPTFLRRLQSKAESGSGLWMISKRDIRRELFAYPSSKDEQKEIVSLVDISIQNIASCEAELAALEDLKRSLLQNLLTGRVRVRVES